MTTPDFDVQAAIERAARGVAGYAATDPPGPPARSAYTDGPAGDAAHDIAQAQWHTYRMTLELLVDIMVAMDATRARLERLRTAASEGGHR